MTNSKLSIEVGKIMNKIRILDDQEDLSELLGEIAEWLHQIDEECDFKEFEKSANLILKAQANLPINK